MKFIIDRDLRGNPSFYRLELTRRNLQALLDKLDDPKSRRSLGKSSEDDSTSILVTAVEDDEHYSDRPPGPVYMPSTGETR